MNSQIKTALIISGVALFMASASLGASISRDIVLDGQSFNKTEYGQIKSRLIDSYDQNKNNLFLWTDEGKLWLDMANHEIEQECIRMKMAPADNEKISSEILSLNEKIKSGNLKDFCSK